MLNLANLKNITSKTLQRIKVFLSSLPLKKEGGGERKMPSLKQWRRFPEVLTKKEKNISMALLILVVFSSTFIIFDFYFQNTMKAPAFGGHYREGVLGQPRAINPLYLSTQDVDRDLVEILFAGLMKYDENGKIINDLAENYQIKDDGKTFEVYLKKNAFWHDRKPITADDIIFTVNLIQDPQYQSPLRIKWSGINIEKTTNSGVRFKLPKAYSGFLENLTIKILPKHIFENIPAKSMPWTPISSQYLVGSGPFQYEKTVKEKSDRIKEIVLKRNPLYYGRKSFLDKISFIFMEDEKELIRRAGLEEIQGFSVNNPENYKKIEGRFKTYALSMPRYFALFFNLKNKNALSDVIVRQALASNIDKEKILKEIFSGRGEVVNSPSLPIFFNLKQPSQEYPFDPQKSSQLLINAGFPLNASTGQREKTIAPSNPRSPLSRNLKFKDQGADVTFLQECLAKDKTVYPEGEVNGYFGEKTKLAVIRFQEKYATDILKPAGLTKGNGEVKPLTKDKLLSLCYQAPTQQTVPLKIIITTCDKFPLTQIADIIKDQWTKLGISVEVQKVSLADLQTNVLAKSNFETLLLGEALGMSPDPFSFWHSSQQDYPGLNITGYNSKEADKILEKIRDTRNEQDLREGLEKFQDVVIKDIPAIFLVGPDYIYTLSSKINGYEVNKITEPAKRFSSIEKYYIKTRRVWR